MSSVDNEFNVRPHGTPIVAVVHGIDGGAIRFDRVLSSGAIVRPADRSAAGAEFGSTRLFAVRRPVSKVLTRKD
jgi:hypothetical protein